MEIRPYQYELLDAYEEESKKYRRIVVVLPTGGGKTVVAAEVIRRAFLRGERVLFVAHRRELVEQAVECLIAIGIPPEEIGTILANHGGARPSARVQVVGIETFEERNVKKGDLPPADLVAVDECHRAVAPTYQKLLKCYAAARVLGLTATPERLDGQGLADAGFEGMLQGATVMRLAAERHLMLPRVWSIGVEGLVDLRGIRADKYGDFAEGEAAARMSTVAVVGKHVEHYERHAAGRATVVYACNIQHGNFIAGRFREAGHDVEEVYGTTSLDERERILGRLERGESVVVVNVDVLTEGWDCPAAKVCIMARPTLSWRLFMQIVGRFLRPWGGVTPTILDHVGNVVRHGMPDAERRFKLVMPKRPKLAVSPEPLAKACAECGAYSAGGASSCVECGAEFPKRALPEEADGELVEYTGPDREMLINVAKERGYPPMWVDHALAEIKAGKYR